MESLQLFLFYFIGDGAAPSSRCKAGATTAAQMQAELCLDLKKGSIIVSPVGDVTKVTSLRTDTTLDLSQKAEKVQQTHSVRGGWERKETHWMVLRRAAQQKGGESGFRSRCLVVANDALYRLS